VRAFIVFVAVVCFSVPSFASEEHHCHPTWSLGVGFSVVEEPHLHGGEMYQSFDFEAIGVLNCPLADSLDFYLEAGVGITNRADPFVPIGAGIVFELNEKVFLGLSGALNLHPVVLGATLLIGPMIQLNLFEGFSFVIAPGFVLHTTGADVVRGGGGTFHFEKT
jgi:hypothetical protein